MLEIYHKYYFSVNVYSQILFYETEYILQQSNQASLEELRYKFKEGISSKFEDKLRVEFKDTRTWVQNSLARKCI